ncbi:hypothetical protein [Actinomyces oris]|uniref:hypothetical protein n=1 Tax=Actinomyces oris TaxID=544580 RepID=UPI000B246EDB
MRDLNDLTRPTVPSGAVQERRGVVGPVPALPGDAGVPTALRTCHLSAGFSHQTP